MLKSKTPFQAVSTLGTEIVGELHATLENERFVGVGTSTYGRVVLRESTGLAHYSCEFIRTRAGLVFWTSGHPRDQWAIAELRALLADELDPVEYRACHWGSPAFGEVPA